MHGLDFHVYLPPPGPPVLATLHLPPDWYPAPRLRADAAGHLAQLRLAGRSWTRLPDRAGMLPPIPNGVPVETLGARPTAQARATR